jgi:hypothetical protein
MTGGVGATNVHAVGYPAAAAQATKVVEPHLTAAGYDYTAFHALVYTQAAELVSDRPFTPAASQKFAVSTANFMEAFDGHTVSGAGQNSGAAIIRT